MGHNDWIEMGGGRASYYSSTPLSHILLIMVWDVSLPSWKLSITLVQASGQLDWVGKINIVQQQVHK